MNTVMSSTLHCEHCGKSFRLSIDYPEGVVDTCLDCIKEFDKIQEHAFARMEIEENSPINSRPEPWGFLKQW